MDNSLIQISKDWMKIFREQNCKIVLLSLYRPQFADIEMMLNVWNKKYEHNSNKKLLN